MGRHRVVPPVMAAPTHNDVEKHCLVMTEMAVHTVTLGEYGSFAAIVHSNPGPDGGAAIAFLDREEVEAHILLLRNAIDDAERIDGGKPVKHAAPTLRRH